MTYSYGPPTGDELSMESGVVPAKSPFTVSTSSAQALSYEATGDNTDAAIINWLITRQNAPRWWRICSDV